MAMRATSSDDEQVRGYVLGMIHQLAELAQGAGEYALADGLRALAWHEQPLSQFACCPEPGGADCTHS